MKKEIAKTIKPELQGKYRFLTKNRSDWTKDEQALAEDLSKWLELALRKEKKENTPYTHFRSFVEDALNQLKVLEKGLEH